MTSINFPYSHPTAQADPKALITAANPRQRTLPLQTLMDQKRRT